MRRLVSLVLMVIGVSNPGFASNKNWGTVHFPTSIRVESKDLPAGDYTITSTDSGAEEQVSFVQGRKVIATAPAKLVPAHNERFIEGVPGGTSIVTVEEGNTTVLTEIQLRSFDLFFDHSAKTGQ